MLILGLKRLFFILLLIVFLKNIKLMTFLIVCEKGVYFSNPDSLAWTKNLTYFRNRYESWLDMSKSSSRNSDSINWRPNLDSTSLNSVWKLIFLPNYRLILAIFSLTVSCLPSFKESITYEYQHWTLLPHWAQTHAFPLLQRLFATELQSPSHLPGKNL